MTNTQMQRLRKKRNQRLAWFVQDMIAVSAIFVALFGVLYFAAALL